MRSCMFSFRFKDKVIHFAQKTGPKRHCTERAVMRRDGVRIKRRFDYRK